MRSPTRVSWGLMAVCLICLVVIGSLLGAYAAIYTTKRSNTVQAAQIIEPELPPPKSPPTPTYHPPIPGSAFHPTYLKPESPSPLIQEAKRYLGVPYLFGGEYARDGAVDCSSYTQMVFRAVGVTLPRTTYGQVEMGKAVSQDELLVGDLIFFANTSYLQTGVTHVGIYTGNGEFIHAAGTIGQVAITPLSDPFYSSHWHSARRVALSP